MVDHIKAQLAAQGIAPPKGQKPPHGRRNGSQQTTAPVAPPASLTAEETDEPAVLPEGPQLGRWQIGPFDLRTTATYAPKIRVVLTGPADDFPHFLAYLQAYQP